MKLALIYIVCMIVFMWGTGLADEGRAEWKVLQQSTYGDTLSYDAASIKQTESKTITVRTRTQSSEYLYEIDCKNKKARLPDGTGGSGWFNILGGEDELLYKAVCP